MYYIYILHSKKDAGLYIGQTTDLKTRVQRHNQGYVTSTKNRRPVRLIHYESFLLKKDALAREEYLKSGYGRKQIRQQLKNLFSELKII